jgi:hypothetical protein
MEILIKRGKQEYGPYSLDTVNSYLASGELLRTDSAWYDGVEDKIEYNLFSPTSSKSYKQWIPLIDIPGVVMPDKLPPPPPTLDVTRQVEDERNGCLECMCFFIPVLGVFFWAIYVNSKPNRARQIAIYSFMGLVTGIVLFVVIGLIGYNTSPP